MRGFAVIFPLAVFLLCGCAGRETPVVANQPDSGPTKPGQQSKLIVTPSHNLVGRVARVNSMARFVVLEFPLGSLPAIGQQLSVYRSGLKVGEITVSGPVEDVFVVADIMKGNAQVNDDVRE